MIRAQVVVSTHSRLKAAGTDLITHVAPYAVSTHSRLKAAGQSGERDTSRQTGFNTQPPEGGWEYLFCHLLLYLVSTHSRLKAAGCKDWACFLPNLYVSTHSRLKAAGFSSANRL